MPLDHVLPFHQLLRQFILRRMVRRRILADSDHIELLRCGHEFLPLFLKRDKMQSLLALEAKVHLVEQAERRGPFAARDLVDQVLVHLDSNEPQPKAEMSQIDSAQGGILGHDDYVQLILGYYVVAVQNLSQKGAVSGVITEHLRA